MKLFIEPKNKTNNSKKQVKDLKNYLQKKGFKTEILKKKTKEGELGRGLVSGISTILTGGETLFSRLGEALVKYVEGRRVDLNIKNTKGEILKLSATIPKQEVRSLINEFLEKNKTNTEKKNIKNKAAKKTKKSTKKKKKNTKTKQTVK